MRAAQSGLKGPTRGHLKASLVVGADPSHASSPPPEVEPIRHARQQLGAVARASVPTMRELWPIVAVSCSSRIREPSTGPVRARAAGGTRSRASHARKFMQLSGHWIGPDGHTGGGDLWAWGEWEPQSQLLDRLDGPRERGYPQYLWGPYYEMPERGCGGLHNTDPFIFGDRFPYSNCKQASSTRLRSLGRGSVIAFGSHTAGRWVLDTVMVIAGSVDYAPGRARSALAGLVPDAFVDVTAGPLADNRQDTSCGPAPVRRGGCGGRAGDDADVKLRLYWGATPEDPVGEMFSFFPAMPADRARRFPRPGIELPDWCFTTSLRQGHKQSCGLSAQSIRPLWGSLTEQVHGAGLVLGTHAAPPCRTSCR